jgi:hypothetical protein
VKPLQLALLVALASAILSIGVGAGLYFGLTHRGASLEAQAPGPVRALPAQVEQATQVALEAERPRLREACGAEVAPRQLRLSVAFDGGGRQIGLGIIDDRQAPRDGVYECLQQHLGLRLRVPPPNVPISVEVPFRFP